jgi:hypothetical protein
MRTHFESNIRRTNQRLADLKSKTAELERQLSDARVSLDRELADSPGSREATPGQIRKTHRCHQAATGRDHGADRISELYRAPMLSHDYGSSDSAGQVHSPAERTEVFINHGRRSTYSAGPSRGRKVAAGTAVVVVIAAVMAMVLFRTGASWPASVTTVQSEAARACQNSDVQSEPGQVNFACAKATRQILWVFAIMTSTDNPDFADAKTGRVGLEPITPAQGGEVAWSLNLHHPYDPSNPIDSIEVAARAINNIIGGATLTRANGKPVVQPGLEGRSANCVRYTGSAAVTSRKGFPKLCAKPVTSPAGQAALVTDIYQKWVVGAAPAAAQDAAVLFENAHNPGDPRVQAILKQLPNSTPLA